MGKVFNISWLWGWKFMSPGKLWLQNLNGKNLEPLDELCAGSWPIQICFSTGPKRLDSPILAPWQLDWHLPLVHQLSKCSGTSMCFSDHFLPRCQGKWMEEGSAIQTNFSTHNLPLLPKTESAVKTCQRHLWTCTRCRQTDETPSRNFSGPACLLESENKGKEGPRCLGLYTGQHGQG